MKEYCAGITGGERPCFGGFRFNSLRESEPFVYGPDQQDSFIERLDFDRTGTLLKDGKRVYLAFEKLPICCRSNQLMKRIYSLGIDGTPHRMKPGKWEKYIFNRMSRNGDPHKMLLDAAIAHFPEIESDLQGVDRYEKARAICLAWAFKLKSYSEHHDVSP